MVDGKARERPTFLPHEPLTINHLVIDDRRLTTYRFIGLGRDPVQGHLKLEPLGLQVLLRCIPGHPDRLPPDEQSSSQRIGDHEAVPARKDFFFEQLNVSGTIGSPVALANWITPS